MYSFGGDSFTVRKFYFYELIHNSATCDMPYRRRWLLSACAYKNEQQGNMRLIKNVRLTASVRLIERA